MVHLITPNAAAASISMLFIFVAILCGLFINKFKPNGRKSVSVLGIILLIAMLAVGIAFPIYLDRMIWLMSVFAYIFASFCNAYVDFKTASRLFEYIFYF